MVGQYIFRMPANTPQLTYAGLTEYISKGRSYYGERKIGSTVEVSTFRDTPKTASIRFRLYGTTLAFISEDSVRFTQNGGNDRHMATGYWLDQIAKDNRIGSMVYRENWERYLLGNYDGTRERTKLPIAGRIFTIPPRIVEHETGVVELFPPNVPGGADPVTCGACGRTWDDSVATVWTPAPGGRCPFEYEHAEAS